MSVRSQRTEQNIYFCVMDFIAEKTVLSSNEQGYSGVVMVILCFRDR